MKTRWAGWVLALVMGAGPAWGQPLRRPAADTLQPPPTRAVPGGRVDAAAGVWRVRYQPRTSTAVGRSPTEAAREHLRAEAAAYGLPPAAGLRLEAVRGGRHVRFVQTLEGLPVYGRLVQVSLDLGGRPVMVFNPYAPVEAAPLPPFRLDAAAATAAALAEVAPGGTAGAATRVVWPAARPRPAWRVVVWPAQGPGEWEAVVDGETGALLHQADLAMAAHESPPPSPPAPSLPLVYRAADGVGLAFDPDPLSTAGVAYGGLYADDADADLPALNAERRPVPLRDLSRGTDGLYRLEGPFVRIVANLDGVADLPYAPPAEAQPDAFRYGRGDPRFEAVNAYYHLDASYRYALALDAGPAPPTGALPVNPRGFTDDNSYYYPERNALVFGTGGVDDAEDAFVVWHEHAHALLEALAPGLRATSEGSALHEGWADYWAASHQRAQAAGGLLGRADWRRFFKWDSGDGQIWAGRLLAPPAGRYPDATRCDDVGAGCNVWQDGLFWAAVLMEGQDALGRAVMDRLVLASLPYLAPGLTFPDAAAAVLQADRDLYGGAHLGMLYPIFDTYGLVNAAGDLAPPRIEHTPPPGLPRAGWPFEVVAAVTDNVGVDSVWVDFALDAADGIVVTSGTFGLQGGGGMYRGLVPAALAPAMQRLRYRVRARDPAANEAVLPAEGWFTVLLESGVAGEAPPEVIARVEAPYPNPAATAATLGYTLAQAAPVQAVLYDALGRRVAVVAAGMQGPGRHALHLDVAALPAGAYWLRFTAGAAVQLLPITVAR